MVEVKVEQGGQERGANLEWYHPRVLLPPPPLPLQMVRTTKFLGVDLDFDHGMSFQ
jgi:hypothetical protein